MSDFSLYKQLETARISSNKDIANAAAAISQSHQRTISGGTFTANVVAAVTETPIAVAAYAANVVKANITIGANQVANATDYNVFTLSKRTGNGAAVTVATANVSNVAITAFVPIAMTMVSNAANTVVAKGDVFTISSSKTGNGVANATMGSVDLLIEDIA